jgi:hypothetical protein
MGRRCVRFTSIGTYSLCLSLLIGAFCSEAALAANGVPAQPLNKTIHISYALNVTSKTPDRRVSNNARNVSRTIYISSLGRIFVRRSAAQVGGRASETNDKGPGESTMRFQNGTLVGIVPYIQGASQATITFGSGFQSCTVNVLIGKDNGKPLKWKSLDGVTLEALGPMTVSGQSCSIRDGNAFAGE